MCLVLYNIMGCIDKRCSHSPLHNTGPKSWIWFNFYSSATWHHLTCAAQVNHCTGLWKHTLLVNFFVLLMLYFCCLPQDHSNQIWNSHCWEYSQLHIPITVHNWWRRAPWTNTKLSGLVPADCLQMNAGKTIELVVDFYRHTHPSTITSKHPGQKHWDSGLGLMNTLSLIWPKNLYWTDNTDCHALCTPSKYLARHLQQLFFFYWMFSIIIHLQYQLFSIWPYTLQGLDNLGKSPSIKFVEWVDILFRMDPLSQKIIIIISSVFCCWITLFPSCCFFFIRLCFDELQTKQQIFMV